MTEQFVEWPPVKLTISETHLASLSDSEDGLVVVLAGDKERVRLAFGVVVAFRSVVEEACVEFWQRFHDDGLRTAAVLVVRDSRWLKTFSDADLRLYPDLCHYMIVTSEERVDVLCKHEPVVRQV